MINGPIGIEALLVKPARQFEVSEQKFLDSLSLIDGGPVMKASIMTETMTRDGMRKIAVASCSINNPDPGNLAYGNRISHGGSLIESSRGYKLQVWDYTEYSVIFFKDDIPVPLHTVEMNSSPFTNRIFNVSSILKLQLGVNMYTLRRGDHS